MVTLYSSKAFFIPCSHLRDVAYVADLLAALRLSLNVSEMARIEEKKEEEEEAELALLATDEEVKGARHIVEARRAAERRRQAEAMTSWLRSLLILTPNLAGEDDEMADLRMRIFLLGMEDFVNREIDAGAEERGEISFKVTPNHFGPYK
jgi:hypothetical protein